MLKTVLEKKKLMKQLPELSSFTSLDIIKGSYDNFRRDKVYNLSIGVQALIHCLRVI